MHFQVEYVKDPCSHYGYFNADSKEEFKRRINSIVEDELINWPDISKVMVREFTHEEMEVIPGGIEIEIPKIIQQVKSFFLLFGPDII